jgi:hypothetical protein
MRENLFAKKALGELQESVRYFEHFGCARTKCTLTLLNIQNACRFMKLTNAPSSGVNYGTK